MGAPPRSRVQSFFVGGFGTRTIPTSQKCVMAPSVGWAFCINWLILFKCSTLTACHHAVLTSTRHNLSISTEKKNFGLLNLVKQKIPSVLPDYLCISFRGRISIRYNYIRKIPYSRSKRAEPAKFSGSEIKLTYSRHWAVHRIPNARILLHAQEDCCIFDWHTSHIG